MVTMSYRRTKSTEVGLKKLKNVPEMGFTRERPLSSIERTDSNQFESKLNPFGGCAQTHRVQALSRTKFSN